MPKASILSSIFHLPSSKKKSLRLILFLFFLVLASCSQQSKRADLVVITGAEPESLDPVIVTGQVDQNIVSELFEGLTRFNKAGLSEPGIAASWDVSADHRVYTFHLRLDAHWSNGEPITAHDVMASWKRVLMPATGSVNSYQLFVIEGAEEFVAGKIDFSKVGLEALDERTLKVTLHHPIPYFIDLCALPVFSIVPIKLIDQVGDDWIKPQHILTNGPYRLGDWRINDKIRLERNPCYWDREHVALQTIDLLPISQANVAYNFYASGEADIIFGKAFPPALIDELKKRDDFHSACFLGTEFLRFNCMKSPFNDPHVRQAFSLCVDQQFLTKKIARAGEIPAYSFVPPGVPNYHSPRMTQYDPVKARQLLAKAGYPGGKNFPLVNYLYNEGQLTEGIAVELQSIWKKELGVSVLLARQEWKVYLASLNQLDYSIGRSSWVGDYPDPNTFLDIFTSVSGNNRTGWRSESYDYLIGQAGTIFNPEERFHLFQQAEQLLVQDQAVIVPLFYYAGVQIYDPRKWGGIEENVLDKHPLWQVYRTCQRSVDSSKIEDGR
ncbi:MAG: peptide ABC transporter substrate-binding protein [Verrucomicrobia bacterium]|nr:peptide ABC transporter substrate-binding protein [Verrucomicrobiota bacterium]